MDTSQVLNPLSHRRELPDQDFNVICFPPLTPWQLPPPLLCFWGWGGALRVEVGGGLGFWLLVERGRLADIRRCFSARNFLDNPLMSLLSAAGTDGHRLKAGTNHNHSAQPRPCTLHGSVQFYRLPGLS